jgi:hypothetical protein
MIILEIGPEDNLERSDAFLGNHSMRFTALVNVRGCP